MASINYVKLNNKGVQATAVPLMCHRCASHPGVISPTPGLMRCTYRADRRI
jgi:hypothetical protein